MALSIKNLRVKVENKTILRGVNLTIKAGEVVALMGPNGSGKSTLAYALAGHPGYQLTRGEIKLNGKNLRALRPDQRSQSGLFLAFQYPLAVAGVSLSNFLRLAYQKITGQKIAPFAFREQLLLKAKKIKLKREFIERSLNDGFSGGEKKKAEILQLMILQPKYAILDETDSGLDIDSLKIVAQAINQAKKDNPRLGLLVITHYERILNYLRPERVVVMKQGRIVSHGGWEIVQQLERSGYDQA